MARRFLSLFCPDFAADRLTQLVEWCDHYSPLVAAGRKRRHHSRYHRLPSFVRRRRPVSSRSSSASSSDGRQIARGPSPMHGASHGHWHATATNLLFTEKMPFPRLLPCRSKRSGFRMRLFLSCEGWACPPSPRYRKIPRRSLAARFGSTLLWRLDQAFHQAEEPLTPWRQPAPHRASRISAEPISTVGAVEYVLRELLQEICERLEKNHLGSTAYGFCLLPGGWNRGPMRNSYFKAHSLHFSPDASFCGTLDTLRCGFGFETFAALRAGCRGAVSDAT